MYHLKKMLTGIVIALLPPVCRAQIIVAVAGMADSTGFSGVGGPATASHLDFGFGPQGLALNRNGDIFFSMPQDNYIVRVDAAGIMHIFGGTGTGGDAGDGGLATAAKMAFLDGLATDRKGNLYLTNTDGSRVRKIDTAGIITNFAGGGSGGGDSGDGGPATAATLQNEADLATDAIGNVYVAEGVGNTIRKIDTAGIITTIAGTGALGFSGDGGPATAAEMNEPVGLAVDNRGNVYFADLGNGRVRKIDTAGIITTIAGTGGAPADTGDGGPATAAELYFAFGVALDAAGNIYITTLKRVRKIDAAGIITTVAGGGGAPHSAGDGGPATAATFERLYGLKIDSLGIIYVSDNAGTVRKIVPVGLAAPGRSEGEEVMRVWPDPNSGAFTVNISAGMDEAAHITILNTLGQKVKELDAVTNKNIPVQLGMPPGMYFVVARTATRSLSCRVLIK